MVRSLDPGGIEFLYVIKEDLGEKKTGGEFTEFRLRRLSVRETSLAAAEKGELIIERQEVPADGDEGGLKTVQNMRQEGGSNYDFAVAYCRLGLLGWTDEHPLLDKMGAALTFDGVDDPLLERLYKQVEELAGAIQDGELVTETDSKN